MVYRIDLIFALIGRARNENPVNLVNPVHVAFVLFVPPSCLRGKSLSSIKRPIMTIRVRHSVVFMGILSLTSLVLAAAGGKAVVADQNPIHGAFQLDGKTYSATQAVAYPAKIFGEPGTTVFLSDRAIPVNDLKTSIQGNLGSDSQFFPNQPYVKITFTKDGKANFAVIRNGGTSISVGGDILTGEVTVKDGRAQGKATLVDKSPTGAKNTFDLSFDLTLLSIALSAEVPEAKTTKSTRTKIPQSSSPRDSIVKTPAPSNPPRPGSKKPTDKTSAANGINAHDLPIPSDATKVEFKKTVKIMHYESSLDYKQMVAFLQEKLPAQGWSANGTDLVATKSAILKRTQGEAALTIFVKPTDAGSKVTVMTDGVSFDEK
jgi:hypothetical protein